MSRLPIIHIYKLKLVTLCNIKLIFEIIKKEKRKIYLQCIPVTSSNSSSINANEDGLQMHEHKDC